MGIGVASLGYNLSEGNYGSAALDALGVVLDGAALAVPLVPGGAGAAIKGIRVLNAVDTTINVGMAAHGTVDAIQQGDALGAGSLGRHANLPGGRGAQNLSAGGGNVGQGIGQGCNCFSDDTLVQTAEGPVPIAEVAVGDQVYALDEETGGVELASVTALFKRTAQSTYRIEVGGGVIETTREHPFFVEGAGWTEAQDLREGDFVDTLDGFTLPVTGIEVVYEPTTVYNFSVNGLHNYYVSEDGVLVHNIACKWTPDYSRPSGYRKGVRDKVWDGAIEPKTGRVRDPKTGQFMSKDKNWDMGHRSGHEFRKHQESARKRLIDRKKFLDEHNDPSHFVPEIPSSNRSHSLEDMTDNYFGP